MRLMNARAQLALRERRRRANLAPTIYAAPAVRGRKRATLTSDDEAARESVRRAKRTATILRDAESQARRYEGDLDEAAKQKSVVATPTPRSARPRAQAGSRSTSRFTWITCPPSTVKFGLRCLNYKRNWESPTCDENKIPNSAPRPPGDLSRLDAHLLNQIRRRPAKVNRRRRHPLLPGADRRVMARPQQKIPGADGVG